MIKKEDIPVQALRNPGGRDSHNF